MLRRGALLTGLLVALCPATAQATYPGVNGPLTVSDGLDAFTLSPDGSSLKRVVRAEVLVLSPDGKRSAYVRSHEGLPCEARSCTEYTRVWVARRNGKDPQPLTRSHGHGKNPLFSPNGRKIFWSDENSFWVARSNTRHKQLLFSAADVGLQYIRGAFDISPDGRMIAVSGSADFASGEQIFIVPTDGEGQAIAVSPGRQDAAPSWSPDGSQIAFTRYCMDPPMCLDAGVFVARADGSEAFELGANDPDLHDDLGVWSPDGRQIAFEFIRSGSFKSGIAVRRAVPNSPVKVLTEKYFISLGWFPRRPPAR